MDKENVVYTGFKYIYIYIYINNTSQSLKREGNPTICNNGRVGRRLNEISQTQKDKHCMISFKCGI
jgi:hypothetical protein